jgi:molybdenum cofactor cytidylyltransferase
MIRGILLAAGAGRRFGGAKLSAPLPSGVPVAVAAGRNLLAGGVDEVTAVVRPGSPEPGASLEAAGFTVTTCPRAEEGMGASLAWGVTQAPADGYLIALGDMPWIRPETIATIAQALREGAPLVRPCHQGRPGHPVGFGAGFRPQLMACSGDRGARHLLVEHGHRMQTLDVPDPGVFTDVDRPGDLPVA